MGRALRQKAVKLPWKLKELRLRLNLSQAELGEKLEVGRIEVGRYEKGTYEPPAVVLLRYARLCKIPLENLIDDQIEI